MQSTPEKIRFRCPSCDVKLAAPAKRAGTEISCPKCDEKVSIPDPAAEEASTPPPAPEPAPTPEADATEAREQWALARCPDCAGVIKVRTENLDTEVACPECDSDLIIAHPE